MSADVTDPTAEAFIAQLFSEASEAERIKYRRYFRERHQEFIGVRMGAVFAAAKANAGMELDQIEHDAHEVRAGAVRIMAEQARARTTTDERRQALAALYLRRHDRIGEASWTTRSGSPSACSMIRTISSTRRSAGRSATPATTTPRVFSRSWRPTARRCPARR